MIRLSDHFTSGRLLRFTLPSIIMLVFTSVYGVVDGFFVTNFVGTQEFAAVNFIMPFLMVMGSVGFMFGTGGSALIAFRMGDARQGFKIVASHTDSPALKLKENPALSDGNYTRLNTEPYGGGLWYTFFDRPLRLAGRVVREREKYAAHYFFTLFFFGVSSSTALLSSLRSTSR